MSKDKALKRMKLMRRIADAMLKNGSPTLEKAFLRKEKNLAKRRDNERRKGT